MFVFRFRNNWLAFSLEVNPAPRSGAKRKFGLLSLIKLTDMKEQRVFSVAVFDGTGIDLDLGVIRVGKRLNMDTYP